MQAAGHLVAAPVAELAAGVQDGQHDLGGRPLLLLHRVDRDAAAVVGDRDAVVGMQRDRDVVAVAREGLVDRVVDDLVDQVVKATLTGRADVHAGPLANRLEPLQHRDVGGLVARPRSRRPPSFLDAALARAILLFARPVLVAKKVLLVRLSVWLLTPFGKRVRVRLRSRKRALEGVTNRPLKGSRPTRESVHSTVKISHQKAKNAHMPTGRLGLVDLLARTAR